MREILLFIAGFSVMTVIFVSLIPVCAEDQTLVRGLLWFECVKH